VFFIHEQGLRPPIDLPGTGIDDAMEDYVPYASRIKS
jgi:hypothetical protein